ncbi:MAG: hypothetical protein FGF50_10760, partial [Candidatus Brockarchaeota archaeon]|nr:hypothetical protein [Candidatus Brockarchaeota archaeon]
MIGLLSALVFSTLLLWALYHLPIIASGVRRMEEDAPIKGPPDTLPTFSVIIPAKDEERVIKRCIE